MDRSTFNLWLSRIPALADVLPAIAVVYNNEGADAARTKFYATVPWVKDVADLCFPTPPEDAKKAMLEAKKARPGRVAAYVSFSKAEGADLQTYELFKRSIFEGPEGIGQYALHEALEKDEAFVKAVWVGVPNLLSYHVYSFSLARGRVPQSQDEYDTIAKKLTEELCKTLPEAKGVSVCVGAFNVGCARVSCKAEGKDTSIIESLNQAFLCFSFTYTPGALAEYLAEQQNLN